MVGHSVAEALSVLGHTGAGGYGKRAGTVDITVDAVLTSGVKLANGRSFTSFESELPGDLTLQTTSSSAKGKQAVVSKIYVSSFTFTFTQNANSTLAVAAVGDSVVWTDLSSNLGRLNALQHIPLTWDKVSIHNDALGVAMLSGVQTCTITATLNRADIYQIGQFSILERAATPPHTVTVALTSLSNDVILSNWLDRFTTSLDAMDPAYQINFKMYGPDGNAWIECSGMRPTDATMTTNVGANSTTDLSFEGYTISF